MSRPRRRDCLQEGLHLNLNDLVRQGSIRKAEQTGFRKIKWTHPEWGEVTTGLVRGDLTGPLEGWLDIEIDDNVQRIVLRSEPRHFGGRQWYFVCPALGLPVSVVWKPQGASQFRSRQAWGSQVAYMSQFAGEVDRAHLGKAKIANRLFGTNDPASSVLPPKPKGIRSSTYARAVERYANYDSVLQAGCAAILARSRREG